MTRTKIKSKEDALLDELLKNYSDPKQILGEGGLLKQLQKKLVEKALEAELTEHLGYEAHGDASGSNRRNGKGRKTLQSETGQYEIEVPRDRDGSFEPQLVKKRQRRLDGFDDKAPARVNNFETSVLGSLVSNVRAPRCRD